MSVHDCITGWREIFVISGMGLVLADTCSGRDVRRGCADRKGGEYSGMFC